MNARPRSAPSCTVALVLLAALAPAQEPPRRVIGYFTSWSVYARNYHVPDIPADRITHVNYAFANVVGGRIALGDPYADIDRFYPGDSWAPGALRGSFRRLQVLKAAHPHVRTLISVGGWTWSGTFSDAVLTAQSRAAFAQSCVDFVSTYDFDGVDLDWEYPVSGGLGSNVTRPADRQNYTMFLRELRQQLDARGTQLGKRFLLSIAVPANPAIAANFEIESIWPIVDWLNVLSYDLHGPWGGAADPVTNFNAPLHPASADPTPQPYHTAFTVAAAVRLYLDRGVPSDRLQIGVPCYGRGFGNVGSGGQHGLYAPYSGPAPFGTWENGVFDWTDVRDRYLGQGDWVASRSGEARVPWLHSASRRATISYDDPRSVREKAWLAKAEALGGVMLWEFSGDRDAELLGAAADEVLRLPVLSAPVRVVPVAAPVAVTMLVDAPPSAAGRGYALLGSFAGRWPGFALPGGDVLPIGLDGLAPALLAAPGPLFGGLLGTLDARGNAAARLGFDLLPALPPALIGLELSFAALIETGVSAAPWLPSNPIEIRFE
ncbi:MAG: glycoside hydrolase family 18 protein [Planctomycetes bacterium]|nr:glycoside hydrolase family 18 protein [Planctomycetota bacterium]